MNSMIKKFSSPKMQNREFIFTPKIEYKLVAERSEANRNRLQIPYWWNYTTPLEHFLNGTLTDCRASRD